MWQPIRQTRYAQSKPSLYNRRNSMRRSIAFVKSHQALVGLTEAPASRCAQDHGCSLRVVVRDGKPLWVHANYKLRRIVSPL